MKFQVVLQWHASGIVDAATSNAQIAWICGDPDVKHFMQSVLQGKEAGIDPKKLAQFREIYFANEPEKANVAKEDFEF